MTYAPSTHKFAMGVGVAGAMVEVTADVLLNEGGVTRRWGRQSTFSDTSPGQFSYTLDNRDGKYTPDNVNSSLATKVTEGMRVSWELNGTLRSGKISATQLIFPPEGTTDAARLRVTVSDVLADAARTDVDVLPQSIVMAARPYAYWPMDDAPTDLVPREMSGRGLAALRKYVPDLAGASTTFGVASTLGWTEAEYVFPTTPSAFFDGTGLMFDPATGIGPFPYPAGSLGFWSFWATRGADTDLYTSFSSVSGPSVGVALLTDGSAYFSTASSNLSVPNAAPINVPVHVAFGGTVAFGSGVWTTTWSLWLNGVAVPGTVTIDSATDPRLDKWAFSSRTGAAPDQPLKRARVSHLAHTATRVAVEDSGSPASAAARLRAIAATVPSIVLEALPSDLSPSLLGPSGSGSALDLFNTVIRGEQGHIWSVTSGTLLAPVEKVKVRARTRPDAVTATFSTSSDIEGAPDLQRNTTNMVSAVTVTGPTGKVTVYDRSLEPRVGSANTSVSVALSAAIDLQAFGEDRILRGINKGIDVVSFDIDPGGTTANRWAELMALTPGLRYRVADLPIAQLGVSTWDGWFLGASESHDGERSMFTLYFEPVLERTAIYDATADRYMAGGALSLSSNINASVTSMSVATSVPGTVFTTAGGDLPIDIVMGTEQMRVTAVTGATPQVFTITRGVNGTTATTHTAGELLELVTVARYKF